MRSVPAAIMVEASLPGRAAGAQVVGRRPQGAADPRRADPRRRRAGEAWRDDRAEDESRTSACAHPEGAPAPGRPRQGRDQCRRLLGRGDPLAAPRAAGSSSPVVGSNRHLVPVHRSAVDRLQGVERVLDRVGSRPFAYRRSARSWTSPDGPRRLEGGRARGGCVASAPARNRGCRGLLAVARAVAYGSLSDAL